MVPTDSNMQVVQVLVPVAVGVLGRIVSLQFVIMYMHLNLLEKQVLKVKARVIQQFMIQTVQNLTAEVHDLYLNLSLQDGLGFEDNEVYALGYLMVIVSGKISQDIYARISCLHEAYHCEV